jgi:hypothetical protein
MNINDIKYMNKKSIQILHKAYKNLTQINANEVKN